jgi:Cd2+/Zn2+-exporting ATPase
LQPRTELEQAGQTVMVVVQDGVAGMLALRDTLRDDAKEAVAACINWACRA